MAEALEDEQLVGPEDPVDGHAGVALQVGQGPGRVRPEDPVDLAGVESESAQPALQVSDVVAPDHGLALIQTAIAEPVAGFDDRRPGLGAADAVDAQAA